MLKLTGRVKKKKKKKGGAEWGRLTGYSPVLVGLCETNKSIRICAEKNREKPLKSFGQRVPTKRKMRSNEILLSQEKRFKLKT